LDPELDRLQQRNAWLRRAYNLLHRRRRAANWLIRDLDRARRSAKDERDRLSAEVTTLTIQGTEMEGRFYEERDRLYAGARRIVATAKAWRNMALVNPTKDERLAIVNAFADAIDAFDPMLSETTDAACPGDYYSAADTLVAIASMLGISDDARDDKNIIEEVRSLRGERDHLRTHEVKCRQQAEEFRLDQAAINVGFRTLVERFDALEKGGDLPRERLDALRGLISPLKENLDDEKDT
jgi:uncharacterized coiled-coil DUF342 family protein